MTVPMPQIVDGAYTRPGPVRPGRTAGGESFPVASRMLSRHVRAKIMAFYLFARMADDVADAPDIDVLTRLDALDRFDEGLMGASGMPEAHVLRVSLAGDAHAVEQARTLLRAFRQDVRGHHYATWHDLRSYCAMSAEPVGRFLLSIHGEHRGVEALSDPLCAALQILNHLQDIGYDKERLARVYLPSVWLTEAGAGPDDLTLGTATKALREVIDRALDECDTLLVEADALPAALRDPGLRAQARSTLHLARCLSRRLRRQDPLAERVAPGRLDFASAGVRAMYHRILRR